MSITKIKSNILNQSIGIAGCGEMGYPMLKMLLQNNINVTGHDVKASETFKEFGNKYIPSKLEFFLKNDVFLSIVRDTKETNNLLIDNNSLLSKKNVTILTINIMSIFVLLMEYLKVQFRPNGLLFFAIFLIIPFKLIDAKTVKRNITTAILIFIKYKA